MGVNAGLIEKTYEAFGRGDMSAVIANMADDVEWSSPATLPQGGRFHGKSGAMQFFEGLGAAWETLALAVEAIGDVGENLVVGVVHAEGTLRSGGSSGYGALHVFTVRGGEITRFREYTDLDAPLHNIG